MNALYLIEIIRTDWLHVLDENWEERDATYLNDFEFWTEWLFQYFNELKLGEAIESDYIMWKS